jgi:hypothetical protein
VGKQREGVDVDGTNVRMNQWMDGRMDGWMDGWIDVCIYQSNAIDRTNSKTSDMHT